MIAGGKPSLIGISGKMGSGKDTLSIVLNYLADKDAPDWIGRWEQDVEEFTYKNKKYSEKLKYMVCFLIGCSRSDLEDRDFKEKELGEEWDGLTPRKLLQLLGTEAGRQIIHPNIWVNALFADYKVTNDCSQHSDGLWYTSEHGEEESEVTPVYPNWIITDVRFPNEAKAIKDRGGILIRINRPQLIERDFEHLSETALDDYNGFDYVIENNSSSIGDLVEQVKQLKIV